MTKGYIYLLFSNKKDSTYIGSTNNLLKRLQEHNAGQSKATIYGRPWKLIYHEEFDTLQEARKREKYLKTHAGRKVLRNIFIEKIIKN